MSILYLAGLAIIVGAILGLVDMLLSLAPFDIGASVLEATCNRRRCESSIPCRRCAPHQHCYAVTWCTECDEWMCMQCWFTYTVGTPAPSEVTQHLSNEVLEIARAAGPHPDGVYVLFCGVEGHYEHADGGGLVTQSNSAAAFVATGSACGQADAAPVSLAVAR